MCFNSVWGVGGSAGLSKPCQYRRQKKKKSASLTSHSSSMMFSKGENL